MTRAKALIVDDNASMRRSLRTILLLRDFTITEASDGLEALSVLAKEHFDIVFSDVSMPNMNGFELLARIKRDPTHCLTPVVLLTAESRSEDVARGAKLGCASYVVKPFNSEKLDQALKAAKLGGSTHLSGG